jgi:hypothetical protein
LEFFFCSSKCVDCPLHNQVYSSFVCDSEVFLLTACDVICPLVGGFECELDSVAIDSVFA